VSVSKRVSEHAVTSLWEEIASSICGPAVCSHAPGKFIFKLAEVFKAENPLYVVRAIQRGDPAYFVAFQVRLDQMHLALAEHGADAFAVSAITRARYVIAGFQDAAAVRLRKLGGTWPLVTDELGECSA